jgi:hypothetical protein
MNFLIFLLLLIPSFISLWPQKILYMILVLNLSGLVLHHNIWSILVIENSMYSATAEWYVPYMSVIFFFFLLKMESLFAHYTK